MSINYYSGESNVQHDFAYIDLKDLSYPYKNVLWRPDTHRRDEQEVWEIPFTGLFLDCDFDYGLFTPDIYMLNIELPAY